MLTKMKTRWLIRMITVALAALAPAWSGVCADETGNVFDLTDPNSSVNVLHVDASLGSDIDNTGTSRDGAFATIQRAVDCAANTDVILVWPGTYQGPIFFLGKKIRIQSASIPAVITAPQNHAVNFQHGEGPLSKLKNVIITGSHYGVFCSGASPTLENITFVNNHLGVYGAAGSAPVVRNCIFHNNQLGDIWVDANRGRVSYSCLQLSSTLAAGEGNIVANPHFVNSAAGDYHLMSRKGRHLLVNALPAEVNYPAAGLWTFDDVNSPCIDAGDPNTPPGNERMPNGGRINMGAYGGTAFASMSFWPIRSDINYDGVVDYRDMRIFFQEWLEALPWKNNQW